MQEVVGLWEELRRHDVTPEKRSKLVSTVARKVTGHAADLAASHAASRVIQAVVKHGTPAERAAILAEVAPRVLELAKSSYGRFVVSKLIDLTPKKDLPGARCAVLCCAGLGWGLPGDGRVLLPMHRASASRGRAPQASTHPSSTTQHSPGQ